MRGNVEKKLVYILNYVHPDDVQHFVHVMTLLSMLKARCGWDIVLLSEKGGEGERVVHGMNVRYLSRKSKIKRLINLAATLVRLRNDGYKLVFVRISKPAAIMSSIVGKVLGMRVLYWLSTANYDLDKRKTFVKRIWDRCTFDFIVKGITRFVTGPEYMLQYYRENYNVPDAKLLLLYNDIDIDRFQPTEGKSEVGDPVRIIFVHSLSPSKNAVMYFPSIIQALNEIGAGGTSIELDIIGDGPERKQLAQQLEKVTQGVKVRMLGAVANKDLPALLGNADIFIMPSYREGMPRALMEAMAMGLPAISTDAGGTRDIVGPRQMQFVVPRDDPQAFAECLGKLINNRALWKKIGQENRMYVHRYSTPEVADMYDVALSKFVEII